MISERKLGVTLNKLEITAERLIEQIGEVVHNPRFAKRFLIGAAESRHLQLPRAQSNDSPNDQIEADGLRGGGSGQIVFIRFSRPTRL